MIRLRGWDDVMGMNLRNARISRENASAAIRLVNDKYATKEALLSVGAPTSRPWHSCGPGVRSRHWTGTACPTAGR